MYGLSDSGWVDSELFHLWFENHFLTHAPASRPLLLIMDDLRKRNIQNKEKKKRRLSKVTDR